MLSKNKYDNTISRLNTYDIQYIISIVVGTYKSENLGNLHTDSH